MALHFPYVAATTITAAVGVITTAVWAAQAPAHVSAPGWVAAQGISLVRSRLRRFRNQTSPIRRDPRPLSRCSRPPGTSLPATSRR